MSDENFKFDQKNFTRDRGKFGIQKVATVILYGMRSSYKVGLADVNGKLDGTGLMTNNGTPSGFTKARAKIRPDFFQHIADMVACTHARNGFHHNWRGYSVYGIDGSTVQIPKSRNVREAFDAAECETPLARISQLVEVYSGLVMNSRIDSVTVGEREMALDHFHRMLPNSLILLDRGYPAGWLFAAMEACGHKVLARVSRDSFACVTDFLESPDIERIVSIDLTRESTKFSQENNIPIGPVRMRLVKVVLSTGEIEVLMTNILDTTVPPDELGKLYFTRWGCETSYRYQKCWGGIKHFTGLTDHSVRQDFFAHTAMWNLVAAMAEKVDPLVEQECKKVIDNQPPDEVPKQKHIHKVNRVDAFAFVRNSFIAIITVVDDARKTLVLRILEMIYDSTSPVRTGRSYERKLRTQPPLNPRIKAIS